LSSVINFCYSDCHKCKKINFNEVENLNLNYFKNSNEKVLNFDFSKSNYENATTIYGNFKKNIFKLRNI